MSADALAPPQAPPEPGAAVHASDALDEQGLPRQHAELGARESLELAPQVPQAQRLSSGVGIALVALAGVVVGAIAIGFLQRQSAAAAARAAGTARDAVTTAAPASAAGENIVQRLSRGAFAGTGERASSPPVDATPPLTLVTDSGLRVPYDPADAAAIDGTGRSGARAGTAEEQFLEQAYHDELAALKAPTGTPVSGLLGTAGAPELMALTTAAPSGDPLAALGPLNAALSRALAPGAAEEQNPQAADREARAQGFRERVASATTRQAGNYEPAPRRGEYVIRAGWMIPAMLEQELNSDLPGDIRALVTQNVYDTATGEHLLIPQGSRLVGSYNSDVGFGQDALQVLWYRIIFPDASTLELGGMNAQDAAGRAGLRGKTDHHARKVVGAALLTSLFSAGYEIAQGDRGGTILDRESAANRAGRGAASEISRVGAQITGRALNVQPTIRIPSGYRVQVHVSGDLQLPKVSQAAT